MHKIIVRAKLPLWYTEGFNPKPKMIFAAPLSIGTESMCEYMDLRLIDDIPPEEAMRRLNENMTDEMQVTDAYYTDSKLTLLKWLSYSITVKTGGASSELAKMCTAVLNSECVMVEKKGKPDSPAVKQNIRPLIKSAVAEYRDGLLYIDCILSADSSSFLNPEYIVKALKSSLGILSDPVLTREYYSVMRREAFCEDMTEFR